MNWTVEFHGEFVPEFRSLHKRVQDEAYAIAHLLEQFGPQLGRPWVDTLNGSRHANMKEMRFGAADGEWRLAFAFDPKRRAILLDCGRQVRKQCQAVLPRPHPQSGRALRPAPRSARAGRRIVMTVSLETMMARLDPERRRKIEERAAELIAEEMTLRELRKARQLTQARVAAELGITSGRRLPPRAAQRPLCSRRCARPWRPWAAASRSSRSFPTARPSSCRASPRAIHATDARGERTPRRRQARKACRLRPPMVR